MSPTKNTKLEIDSLYIEITRNCNMSCAHCMRGPAQDRTIFIGNLRPFFERIGYIGTIGFSGGEPTLNMHAIEAILEMCKEYNIPVMNFYMATNGKELPERFCEIIFDWYEYIQDGETTEISLSTDEFHEPISPENLKKLKVFSFFNIQSKHINFQNSTYPTMLDLGNAVNLPSDKYPKRIDIQRSYGWNPLYDEEKDVISLPDKEVYISVNCNILETCDYAYDEEPWLTVGKTTEPEDFIELLYDEAEII